MHKLKLIITREFLARVKNKTFITMTFLSPVIAILMFLLIAYLININNSKTSTVAIHDETGQFFKDFHSSDQLVYKDFSNLSLKVAIDSSKTADLKGLLVIPKNALDPDEKIIFYSNGAPNTDLISNLEAHLSQIITHQKLIARKLDLKEIAAAQTQISLSIEDFSGQHTSKIDTYVKMIFGGGAGYLLMMFIIIYGNMVMRSVIEEKTNRIIEIIISSVKPIQLMLGKILGTSFAGITQFVIWIVFGGILFFVAEAFLHIDLGSSTQMAASGLGEASSQMINELFIDIARLPLTELIICFLIYFIGGYFLYSAIYAAIGAAVDNETDTQQFMFPIMVPLILAIYVGFFSVIGDPHGTVSVIFSYIPLTSPIVMLMRIPFGVAWWEILISMVLLFITIIGVVWLGAKIYRVGILMYGKKPSYKEIGKWMKY